MKHLKHFLLTMLIAFVSSVSAFAYDFEVDGIYYNVLSEDDRACEVTSGDNKYSGEVIIPSSVTDSENTYKVVKIGYGAFFGSSGLTSVTVGYSVTTIGDYAFYYCSGLTAVEIPNSVTKIGDGAFLGCSGLTSVSLPNSVTEIEGSAFYNCNGLTSPVYNNTIFAKLPEGFEGEYIIPDGIMKIASGAFSFCHELTSITIPSSVTEIGDNAFMECI